MKYEDEKIKRIQIIKDDNELIIDINFKDDGAIEGIEKDNFTIKIEVETKEGTEIIEFEKI